MFGEFVAYLGTVSDPVGLALAGGIILLAYTIFGLTGFGSSITAIPFLIQIFPLHLCVSIMLLFDLVTCSLLNLRDSRFASRVELKRIIPFLLLGAILGILLSLHAPKKPLFLLLGVFILSMVIWNNFFARTDYRIRPVYAFPMSFLGGAFTTLFGTGGPMYTLYLVGRLDDKKALRATLGALIGLTSIIRLVLFLLAGLLSNPAVYAVGAVLFPCALLGFLLGSALNRKVATQAVKRVVWVILLVGGLSALAKGV